MLHCVQISHLDVNVYECVITLRFAGNSDDMFGVTCVHRYIYIYICTYMLHICIFQCIDRKCHVLVECNYGRSHFKEKHTKQQCQRARATWREDYYTDAVQIIRIGILHTHANKGSSTKVRWPRFTLLVGIGLWWGILLSRARC